MTARLIDGRATASDLLKRSAVQAATFRRIRGRPVTLALLCGGTSDATRAYVARIEAFAEQADVTALPVALPEDATCETIAATVARLNEDDAIDAILPLAPLPGGIAMRAVAAMLSPAKDADGLTPENAGRLAAGQDGLYPCTPQAALHIARDLAGDLRGRTATVVGASATVGWPLATLLVRAGATVTIAHADTRDLIAACRGAELLFVAAGRAGLIDARHVAPGAIVVDIGINAIEGGDGSRRIVGDVLREAVMPVASAITAVPDGVGPVTTALLIDNSVRAAMARAGILPY